MFAEVVDDPSQIRRWNRRHPINSDYVRFAIYRSCESDMCYYRQIFDCIERSYTNGSKLSNVWVLQNDNEAIRFP